LEALLIIGIVVIFLFAGVVAFGAPYLPTLSNRVNDAIELLDLRPGQTMLELGSGDGRLLRAAAKKGIYSIGYELNPVLVIYAKIASLRYGKLVRVRWANYWTVDWPPADGMYVFLLNPYMSKLHKKVVQYSKGKQFRLVSFAFKIQEKKASKDKDSMFLYIYN
jgi:SAM-dependent methyltransferase